MILENQYQVQDDEVLEQLGLLDQYIIQKKEGYRFTIDPILLASFAEVAQGDHIVDLGTGGGILPFLLYKKNIDKNIMITGIDIQEEYIGMAERSRIGNQLDRITFKKEDINLLGKEYASAFDVVITNPPFFKINEGKISQRNDIAIARHEIMVTFDTLVQKASYCLTSKGRFVFIQRAERLPEIMVLLEKKGFCPRSIQFIYPNQNSGAKLFMMTAVRGTKRVLSVLPPLIVYDLDGQYSEKVRVMYE